MSRIGKLPVTVPAGVEVEITDSNLVTVKGPKGTLSQQVSPAIKIEKKDGHLVVRPNIRLGELAHSAKEMTLKGNKAYLRISSDGAYYYMQASADGKTFETLAKMDFRYLSTEVIGGFTGVMLGVFTQGENTNGVADFDWFEYK